MLSNNSALSSSVHKKFQKGFTLLEVMVAMAILGIGLVGIFGLFSSALKSAHLSHIYTIGTMLAREKMEEISSGDEIRTGSLSGEFEGEYKEFNWQAEIEPYEFREDVEKEADYEGSIIKMYKIQVRVSGEEIKKKEIKLVTLKTVLENKL